MAQKCRENRPFGTSEQVASILNWRYGSTIGFLLVFILSIFLMLWGLGNSLLEQLVAIGQAVSGMTGGTIPYQVAVIVFVFVMLAYELMGGMKAVAFTDVMQGIALLIGIIFFLVGGIYVAVGSLSDVTHYIIRT